MNFEDWYEANVGITVVEAKTRGVYDIDLMRQCFSDSLKLGSKRLLDALDGMDRGCTEPGFRGHENGLGEDSGNELQEAREELVSLTGHVPIVEIQTN